MTKQAEEVIEVSVAWVDAEGGQFIWQGPVPVGATVAMALAESALGNRIADSGRLDVGIHGRLVSRDQLLEAGDRVELYRPLLVDPKHARRQRAAARGRRAGAK